MKYKWQNYNGIWWNIRHWENDQELAIIWEENQFHGTWTNWKQRAFPDKFTLTHTQLTLDI